MSNALLIPLDGSPLADAAIPPAIEIARRLQLGINLVRVHVPVAFPVFTEFPAWMPDPGLDERVRASAESWLRQKAADVSRTTGIGVTVTFSTGDPAAEIVAVAEQRRPRAIVCSTHGVGGLAPHWIGSVADALVRNAPCPVLALPPGAPARFDTLGTLLVLLDGSPVSDAILPHAAWLAGAFGAGLELLSVVAPPWISDSLAMRTAGEEDAFGIDTHATAVKARLDRLADGLRASGLRVKATVAVDATPARRILEHVARTNPDAVALATYGRGFSRLFLGSVADKVLRSSGRPALLLRPSREAAGIEVAATAGAGSTVEAGV